MAKITPEEMAKGNPGNEGKVTELIQAVGKGLQALQQTLASSPGVTEQDTDKIDQILAMYADLIENSLGATGPGENPEEPVPETMNQMPMNQGMGGKPMGPQTRN